MKRKGMAILAGALVVLLAWANVGLAGQKDRLREKVRTLAQRVSALEQQTSAPYVISPDRIQTDQCADGQPAVWRTRPNGGGPSEGGDSIYVRLSC